MLSQIRYFQQHVTDAPEFASVEVLREDGKVSKLMSITNQQTTVLTTDTARLLIPTPPPPSFPPRPPTRVRLSVPCGTLLSGWSRSAPLPSKT